jgi:hypothetical protein
MNFGSDIAHVLKFPRQHFLWIRSTSRHQKDDVQCTVAAQWHSAGAPQPISFDNWGKPGEGLANW